MVYVIFIIQGEPVKVEFSSKTSISEIADYVSVSSNFLPSYEAKFTIMIEAHLKDVTAY